MIADRTSASSGLTRRSLSVSVLLGAICSSGTSSPVVGSRYSVMPWWVSSRSSSRRLVAAAGQAWRREHHRPRRPAVWSPGEHLVIDWGVLAGLHVFCAVLAWSRWRFTRFAADERAETTLGMLAECFEVLGGVPGRVLADRMA